MVRIFRSSALGTVFRHLFDGDDHAQSAGTDEVVQRCIHFVYFAVGGNACLASARLDGELLRSKNIEIASFVQETKKREEGQPHQIETAGAIGHKEGELASIQPLAPADIQAFYFILIIADEYEGGVTQKLLSIQEQTNTKKRVVPQNREGGLSESQPLVTALLLLLFAPAQHAGIDAEARIV